jgi:hypothetical protein
MGLRQVTVRLSAPRRLLRGTVGVMAPPIAVLGALAMLAACFDESTYQGGGRRDIGGKLAPVDGGEGEDADGAEPADAGSTASPDAALVRDATSGG